MAEIEKIKKFFKDDIFAMDMGIEILKADPEESVCEFSIQPKHLNANGFVQGGAIFTLADFTFAVAGNSGTHHTVSQTVSISFLKPGKGKKLVATAKKISAGSRTCLYEVFVKNEADKLIACATANGFIVD